MIELGKYRAYKYAAMDLAGAVFLLDEGGEIEVEQIDVKGKKVLVRCGRHIDWMHFSRIHKCFTRINK